MYKDIQFIKSVYDINSLPKDKLPQIILCGRSNVGKSSFINSLFNRKNLAKTSSSPGKTRSINFYQVDNLFFMVDLPGYGYAKTSLKERRKWGELISKYILNTESIHHAFHLIDSRYIPTDLDVQLNEWLKAANLNYTVILNKSDKLKQSEIKKAVSTATEIFPELEFNNNLFLYSSVTARWKKALQKRLTDLFL